MFRITLVIEEEQTGHPKAMREEAGFIRYGWVSCSLQDAYEYYVKASELGDRESFARLGDCYRYGWGCEQNFQKACECYKKASRYKYRKIIKQLSKKDFCLEDGEEVLKEIRDFYN